MHAYTHTHARAHAKLPVCLFYNIYNTKKDGWRKAVSPASWHCNSMCWLALYTSSLEDTCVVPLCMLWIMSSVLLLLTLFSKSLPTMTLATEFLLCTKSEMLGTHPPGDVETKHPWGIYIYWKRQLKCGVWLGMVVRTCLWSQQRQNPFSEFEVSLI